MEKQDKKLQDSYLNIDTGYEVLTDEYKEFQKRLNSNISILLNDDNDSNLNKMLELRKKAKEYLELITKLKKDWDSTLIQMGINADISEELSEELDEDENISAVERTSWKIVNDTIRIETIRPNNKQPYTNNIPASLFKDTVLTIVEQFERYKKDTIKTSSIEVLMRDKIISESSYKKATKSFVYSIFKVLQKEGLLTPFESMKRIYTISKDSDEIKLWLDTLKLG